MDLPNDLLHCQAEDCQFTRKYKKRCEMCNNYKTVCFGHHNTGYKCYTCWKSMSLMFKT